MKKLGKNRILAVVLLLFAAVVYGIITTFPLPVINATGDPGPRLFPTLGVLLVAAGSIGLLLQKEQTSAPFMSKPETKRLLLLAGGYIAYAAGLWALGFLLVTPVMLYLVMGLMAQGKPLKLVVRIIYSVGITAVLYWVFTYLLKFKLPGGFLFGLL